MQVSVCKGEVMFKIIHKFQNTEQEKNIHTMCAILHARILIEIIRNSSDSNKGKFQLIERIQDSFGSDKRHF